MCFRFGTAKAVSIVVAGHEHIGRSFIETMIEVKAVRTRSQSFGCRLGFVVRVLVFFVIAVLCCGCVVGIFLLRFTVVRMLVEILSWGLCSYLYSDSWVLLLLWLRLWIWLIVF